MSEKFWKLGIIGWPLGYSLSPIMQEAALRAAGLQGEYKEYPVEPEDLERWLEIDAPRLRLDGFNVTMPHKEAVYRWICANGKIQSEFLHLVEKTRALNTVEVKKSGKLCGENTDGLGFVAALLSIGLKLDQLRGKKVFLLGAGGAAQTIAVYLAWEGISRLVIWNQHQSRAEMLAERIRDAHFSCSPYVSVTQEMCSSVREADIVINATPLGMEGYSEVPAEVIEGVSSRHLICDIVYDPRETMLIRMARKRNCLVMTGDAMLIGQGAVAFEFWTGIRSDSVWRPMQKALDEHFAKRAS